MTNSEKGHKGWVPTHGYAASRQPEYTAWSAARQRCTNPNNPAWHNYGGRGITMHSEWVADFQAFLAHIGPKPDPTYTLDRIDNERGYEPGNVRWTTYTEQARNRRHRNSHNRFGGESERAA